MPSSSLKTYVVSSVKISPNVLQDFSDDLPPPMSSIVSLAQRIVVAAEAVQANVEDCEDLKKRLLEILAVVLMNAKGSSLDEANGYEFAPGLKENFARFQQTLKNIWIRVEKISKTLGSDKKRDKVKAWVLSDSYTADIRKCKDDLTWAMEVFKVASSLSEAVQLYEFCQSMDVVADRIEDVSTKIDNLPTQIAAIVASDIRGPLGLLWPAIYASYDCERPDRPANCFPGTRTAILETISNWAFSTDVDEPAIFWLMGTAGIGKTTVARSAAENVAEALGGDYFFSRRGEAELRDPSRVFPTLAYRLARFDPEFEQRIIAALDADPDAPKKSLQTQLNKLIVEPLSGIDRGLDRPVIIILDAFDECEPRGATEILALLVDAMPRLSFMKVFMTSRDEAHIRTVLAPSEGLKIAALHDIEDSVVRSDIQLYLDTHLRGLGVKHELPQKREWISSEEVNLLADQAGNLFIHAATSIRFLDEALDLRDALAKLIGTTTSNTPSLRGHHPFSGLDDLYRQILLAPIQRYSSTRPNALVVVDLIKTVLGTIVVLRDPLPVEALERLAGLPTGRASMLLRHLHSIIIIPESPVECPRFYHPSLPDYIQSRDRCRDNRIWIDTMKHEARLALRCLRLMNERLRVGMLGSPRSTLLNAEIPNYEAEVRASIPPDLRYGCLFWAAHLSGAFGGGKIDDLKEALESFASKSLLAWLEVLSYLGQVGSGIPCLNIAVAWAITSSANTDTTVLLKDAHRLLLAHSPTISISAPHIIRSVLPLMPPDTLLSRTYRVLDSEVANVHGMALRWSPDLATLLGYHDRQLVHSITFSLDGTRIASTAHFDVQEGPGSIPSAEWVCDLRIWDVGTGKEVKKFRAPGELRSTMFLHRGDRVACLTHRGLTVWDTDTGQEVTEFSVSGRLRTLSNVGSVTAWNDQDNMIHVWSESGDPIVSFSGPARHLDQLTASGDGSLLAFVVEGKVEIWGVKKEAAVQLPTFKSDLLEISEVTLSSRGTYLQISDDYFFEVWCTRTGTKVFDLTRGLAVFSADERCFAKCDRLSGLVTVHDVPDDATIIKSNQRTKFRLRTTFQIPDNFSRLALAPNGLRLASSHRHTIRLWDTTCKPEPPESSCHGMMITDIAIDPSGRHIATACTDMVTKIWDIGSREVVGVWRVPGLFCQGLAFSHDGLYIAQISESLHSDHDGPFMKPKLMISNARTRKTIHEVDILVSNSCVCGIGPVYSPDGSMIAVAISDTGAEQPQVLVWDLESGVPTGRFQQVSAGGVVRQTWGDIDVVGMVFLPDRTHIAVLLGSVEVLVFNARTGQLLRVIKPRDDGFRAGWNSSLVYLPERCMLYANGNDGMRTWVQAWDFESGEERELTHIDINRNAIFYDGEVPPSIVKWDLKGKPMRLLLLPHSLHQPRALAFHEIEIPFRGCRAVLGYDAGRVVMIDIKYPTDS